jgi:NAD-dependent dihydropyrimidine dehydrogenase PreA subunit/nitroreductase
MRKNNMSNYIEIDINKCVGCGRCANECPCDCLVVQDKKVLLIQNSTCLSCGHCGAVCSENAIKSSYSGRKHFLITNFDADLSPEQLLFCKKRSVRAFKTNEISDNILTKLVEFAEKAPSAENIRSRKYFVLNNEDKINQVINCIRSDYKKLVRVLNPVTLNIIKIVKKDYYKELKKLVSVSKKIILTESSKEYIFGKSHCIVCIAAPKRNLFSRDDCIGAQHYMMLYGQTKNIDSFIVGFAQSAHKKIEHVLDVPKDYSIYAISAFGYSKYEYVKDIKYPIPEIVAY